MGYDPIDTSETDNTADRKISIDELNGANIVNASVGEALTSDGSGGFNFTSVGGDTLLDMQDFLSQSNMQQVVSSASDSQAVLDTGLIFNVLINSTARNEFFNSSVAMNEFAESDFAMESITEDSALMNEVANNSTSMSELADSSNAISIITASSIAVEEVGLSSTAQTEISNSTTAVSGFNSASVAGSHSESGSTEFGFKSDVFTVNYAVWFKSWTYTGFDDTNIVSSPGLYDGNTFLGTSVSNQFVQDPKIGWGFNSPNAGSQTASATYEAVVYE